MRCNLLSYYRGCNWWTWLLRTPLVVAMQQPQRPDPTTPLEIRPEMKNINNQFAQLESITVVARRGAQTAVITPSAQWRVAHTACLFAAPMNKAGRKFEGHLFCPLYFADLDHKLVWIKTFSTAIFPLARKCPCLPSISYSLYLGSASSDPQL